MPPGIGYGDGATGILEGLVGGFLMGHDFRTQRDDRKRRLAQEEQAAMQAAEDRRIAAEARARSTAIEDVNLRSQHGLVYDPSAPSGAAATPLTRAVQQAYNVPEGFRRVGPSAQERAAGEVARIRKQVGGNLVSAFNLDMSPEAAYDLQERDMLDDYLERTTPRALTGTVSRGGVSVAGVPLDQTDEVLGRLPAEATGSAGDWSIQNTAGGLIRVNDVTGEVQPVMRDGEQVRAPSAAGGRPTEIQMRLGQVLPRAESALETIEGLLEEFGGSVPVSTLGRRLGIGGQYARPEKEQQFNQAAEALTTAILRAESGAAITRDEQQSYREQFIPSPGDRPATVAQKLNALRQTLRRMQELSTAGGVQAIGEMDAPAEEFSPDNPWR